MLVRNLLSGESKFHGMHESIPGQQQAPGKPIRFLLLLLVETAHYKGPVLRKDYGSGLVVKDQMGEFMHDVIGLPPGRVFRIVDD